MKFHKDMTLPNRGEIFVFGSNLAGRHGAGAALVAAKQFGAKRYCGIGRTGDAYAIPTKGYKMETLTLPAIKTFVNQFLVYVEDNDGLEFFVTRIGCLRAGYQDEDIAPMFARRTFDNCNYPEEWKPYLK